MRVLVVSVCRAGKPTYFSAVFNTLSPAIKQSWISNLQMAKLALGTVHLLSYFFYSFCIYTWWSFILLIVNIRYAMLNLFYKLLPSSCSDILERGSCVTVPYAHCVVHIIELCVCVCVRGGQCAGLVLCRGWWKSNEEAETPPAASTNARGHVQTAGV